MLLDGSEHFGEGHRRGIRAERLEGGDKGAGLRHADLHGGDVGRGPDRLLGEHVAEAALAICQDLVSHLVIEAVLHALHDVAVQKAPRLLIAGEHEGHLHHVAGPVDVRQGQVADDRHLVGPYIETSEHLLFAAQLRIAQDVEGDRSAGPFRHLLREQDRIFVILILVGGRIHMAQLQVHSGELCAPTSRRRCGGASVRTGTAAGGQSHCHTCCQDESQGLFHHRFLLHVILPKKMLPSVSRSFATTALHLLSNKILSWT